MTKNYFDHEIKHQVDLIRAEAGEMRRIRRILSEADNKIDVMLRVKGDLPRHGTKAFQRMVDRILKIRAEAMTEIRRELTDDLRRLADIERTFEIRALKNLSPITSPIDVHLNTLRSKVFSTPFSTSPGQMANFDAWVKSLAAADARRIEEAMVSASRTGQDARRLLIGTRSSKFTDGLLYRTVRNTDTVVRTSFTHLSSTVRDTGWEANDGIIAYRWTAMLDRKLCPICLSHHGRYIPANGRTLPKGLPPVQPPGLRPTLHANCRCILVPVFSLDGLLDLPTSDEWLMAQSGSVQDSVLGLTRAKLFREGKIEASALTNQLGRLITLDQLAEL